MRKQRLVLDLGLPIFTHKIGRIGNKQGFSEVSVIGHQQTVLSRELSASSCRFSLFDSGLATVGSRLSHSTNQLFDYSTASPNELHELYEPNELFPSVVFTAP